MINKIARAICIACEENPDVLGDARGNEYRWQDYIPVAEATIQAIGAVEVEGIYYDTTVLGERIMLRHIPNDLVLEDGQRVRALVMKEER